METFWIWLILAKICPGALRSLVVTVRLVAVPSLRAVPQRRTAGGDAGHVVRDLSSQLCPGVETPRGGRPLGCAPAWDPSLRWGLMPAVLQTPLGVFPRGELCRDARCQPMLATHPSATEPCGHRVSLCREPHAAQVCLAQSGRGVLVGHEDIPVEHIAWAQQGQCWWHR